MACNGFDSTFCAFISTELTTCVSYYVRIVYVSGTSKDISFPPRKKQLVTWDVLWHTIINNSEKRELYNIIWNIQFRMSNLISRPVESPEKMYLFEVHNNEWKWRCTTYIIHTHTHAHTRSSHSHSHSLSFPLYVSLSISLSLSLWHIHLPSGETATAQTGCSPTVTDITGRFEAFKS